MVYPIVRNDSAESDERKHLYDEHEDMKFYSTKSIAELYAADHRQ